MSENEKIEKDIPEVKEVIKSIEKIEAKVKEDIIDALPNPEILKEGGIVSKEVAKAIEPNPEVLKEGPTEPEIEIPLPLKKERKPKEIPKEIPLPPKKEIKPKEIPKEIPKEKTLIETLVDLREACKNHNSPWIQRELDSILKKYK